MGLMSRWPRRSARQRPFDYWGLSFSYFFQEVKFMTQIRNLFTHLRQLTDPSDLAGSARVSSQRSISAAGSGRHTR